MAHYKSSGLHQRWSIITIIGGSGTGKSRFSYETWNLLLDFIKNKPEKCLEFLNNDKEIFSKFQEFISSESIIEVFNKESNGDGIKRNESIINHLQYCLLSCLLKTTPTAREYISTDNMKINIKIPENLNFNDILESIRMKMNIPKEKPLTILWRVDEVQFIELNSQIDKIINEKDEKTRDDIRHSTILYQYVSEIMSICLNLKGTSTFIIPIFSGTSDERLKKIMPASFYKVISIPLYISDISLETARFLMETEIDSKVMSRIQNLNLFLMSLGPIPRLLQFSVEYLKKKPTSSLKELYNHIQDQVKILYKLYFDKNIASLLLIEMIDQWTLKGMDSTFLKYNKILIESGQIFQTREDTLMMPLIFIELLFDEFSKEWEPLKNYISRGIKGEIFPVDLELFPCYFYSFKIHLYQNLGITSMDMRSFFKGAYMNQNIEKFPLIFQKPMSVEISQRNKVNDILNVEAKRRGGLTIDMSKNNVSLHIGKQDPHHDFLISFSESSTLIRGECKYSDSRTTVIFSGGESENSFLNKQKKVYESNCKLEKNYFLFITNAHMTEEEKEKIVDETSIFINKERWTKEFSPIYEFLKDLSIKKSE